MNTTLAFFYYYFAYFLVSSFSLTIQIGILLNIIYSYFLIHIYIPQILFELCKLFFLNVFI